MKTNETSENERAGRTTLRDRSACWFDAVTERHSTRTLNEQRVDPELLEPVASMCRDFRPHLDARVELVVTPEVDVFRGIMGGYGKITGAPHLLVMIAGNEPQAQQHAGYTGEACVLEATARGLATCWVGGFFDRKMVAKIVDIKDDERVVAVSPLGYPTESLSMSDRLMKRVARSSKRLDVNTIAEDFGRQWPDWARCAVEAARLAPSAMNRQPWRFRFAENKLYLGKTMGELPGVTKALDCGIAMLHAQVGAYEAGADGSWSDLDEMGDLACFTPTRPEISD